MASGKLGEGLIDYMIGLAIGVAVVVAVLPTAFGNLNILEQDTTNFSAMEIALIGIISLVIIVSLIRGFLKRKGT